MKVKICSSRKPGNCATMNEQFLNIDSSGYSVGDQTYILDFDTTANLGDEIRLSLTSGKFAISEVYISGKSFCTTAEKVSVQIWDL